MNQIPINIILSKSKKNITLEYTESKSLLDAEFLRVNIPSAEVRGHSSDQKKTVSKNASGAQFFEKSTIVDPPNPPEIDPQTIPKRDQKTISFKTSNFIDLNPFSASKMDPKNFQNGGPNLPNHYSLFNMLVWR